jgi:hypothetical protein
MLTFLKKFLSRKVSEPVAEVPYKVEAPASAAAVKPPVTCGCGRSTTGECVGLHALTADQWAVSDKNPNRVVATPVEVAPVPVETPAVVDTVTAVDTKPVKEPKAKPAVKKAPADKKPRAPRKPKASV